MKQVLNKSEQNITHNLAPHFEAIKAFQSLQDLQQSDLYRKLGPEIEHAINGIAYRNTITNTPGDIVRVVAWNIERGLKLDGIIHLLKTHPGLSKADILLITEADIGMGRTQNRDVPLELANALNMNYVFAPCFLALEKGDIGEQDHDTPNALALHGISILSRFPIQSCQVVPLPMFKDVFNELEKRLGSRKGLICTMQLDNRTYDFAVTHLELATSASQRGKQMTTMINALQQSDAEAQLLGGDFNTTTYNLRSKISLFGHLLYKAFWGIPRVVRHYMTPEKHFEKPLFDEIKKRNYDVNTYNDLTAGTLYYDINDKNIEAKIRQYRIPAFVLTYLRHKLKPWNGCVPLRLDWFVGKGCHVVHNATDIYSPPQVIDTPLYNDTPVSDHSPIVVDLIA
ncbi:MAG: hypothetical protein QGG64_24295 [Candidatus Latescibacteria bacterium]|jgi:endonuclease/exonuclease/phosphatase family metal-dependent hydrolase|nr:hypothetical protein [Candidatus Latescibacterota bacterium]